VFLALATAITVFIISRRLHEIIEHFRSAAAAT